jgi:hypothetical protein
LNPENPYFLFWLEKYTVQQKDRRNLRRSDKLLDLLLDALAALLAAELLGAVFLALGLPVLGRLALAGIGVGEVGVLADLGMSLLVDLLETIGCENVSNCSETAGRKTALTLNTVLDVLLELRLVAFLIVVGKGLHVLSNVTTEDVPKFCQRANKLNL